jgi:hypothetical protein
MALPASGQISMNDIYTEFSEENSFNESLYTVSTGGVATINTVNAAADRPDGVAPHAMSEFYSYNHNATSASWGGAWSGSGWTITANPGTTSYLNRSISYSGFSSDTIDIYYTLVSGTVRGGLSVAVSTSAFPTNSATFYTVSSGTGSFTTAISLTGSGTLYCRFKYIQHSSLYETADRDIYVTAAGETSPELALYVFDDGGGGFP